MKLTVFGNTDVGMQRDHNEDSFLLLHEQNGSWSDTMDFKLDLNKSKGFICVVADGMGGANAGEVASNIAVKTVRENLQSNTSIPDTAPEIRNMLFSIILDAHSKIVKASRGNRNMQGMGTTIVIGCFKMDSLYVAWSGDSRCYVYNKAHDKNLYPFTDDHSLVWERVKNNEITEEQARLGNDSNLILQSLGGSSQKPEPDFKWVNLKKNDRILFCSDGLNSMLSGIGIQQILDFNPTSKNACLSLIEAAKKAGGSDNITTIVVDVIDGPEEALNSTMEETFIPNNGKQKKKNSGKLGLFIVLIIVLGLVIAGIIYHEELKSLFQSFTEKQKTTVFEDPQTELGDPEIIANAEFDQASIKNEPESNNKKTNPDEYPASARGNPLILDSLRIENSIKNSLDKISFIKNTAEWYKPGGKIGSSQTFYEGIKAALDSILATVSGQERLIQNIATTTRDLKLVRITDYKKASRVVDEIGDTLGIMEKKIRLIFGDSPANPTPDSLTN